MTPKVSVIIPVYNVEKYLEKCLESVTNQTYCNLEIILINDGSTDLSVTICKQYVLKDERVVLINQINKGVGYARNQGLSYCTGDFVVFVDSDDFLNLDYIQIMVNSMLKYNVDLVLSGYCRISLIEGITKKEYVYFPNKLMNYIDFFNEIFLYLDKMLIQGPCFKLFKTEIIKNFNVKFDEYLSFGEDTVFMYSYLNHVQSIYNIQSTDYNYMNYTCSTLSTKPTGEKTEIFLFLYDMLEKMLKKKNLFNPLIEEELNKKYCNLLIYLQYDISHLEKKERYKQIHNVINNPKVIRAFKSINSSNLQYKILRFLMKKKYVRLIDFYFILKSNLKKLEYFK